MEKNLPDFKVWAADHTNGSQGYVGAGWLDTDGSISIKLHAFVVLHPASVIKLYQNIPKPASVAKRKYTRRTK